MKVIRAGIELPPLHKCSPTQPNPTQIHVLMALFLLASACGGGVAHIFLLLHPSYTTERGRRLYQDMALALESLPPPDRSIYASFSSPALQTPFALLVGRPSCSERLARGPRRRASRAPLPTRRSRRRRPLARWW